MPLKEKKGCADSSAPRTRLVAMTQEVYEDLTAIVMEFVDDYTRVHKSSPLAKRDNDKFTRVLRVKDALRLDVMKL